MSSKNLIYSRVVDFTLTYKNGFVCRKSFDHFRKLDYCLPVNLDFSYRRLVLCWQKTSFAFIVPSLVDRKSLMSKVKIIRSQGKGLRKTHPGFSNQEYKPIPAYGTFQVEIDQKSMKLKLIQVFDLLRVRRLSFYDCFACRISLNQTVVNGIENRAFQLMMEVHSGLPFVASCVIVQKLLVDDPVHIAYSNLRDQSFKPRLSHQVFIHRDLSYRSFFIDAYPLSIILAEQVG